MMNHVSIFDTASRQLQTIPHDNPVTIYTCGPTVYSEPHLGNWRAFIFYDTLVRTLKVSGYTVERTMNLTDVGHLVGDGDDGEDKLQKAALKQRKTAWDVAEQYIASFEDGMKALNMIQPDHTVRATGMINEQIKMVQILEEKGFAYKIDDGMYFDTSQFAEYGAFARLNLDKQKEGARVTTNDQKRNPSDFALWKFSPKDAKRDMEWESPWGAGFPGWHLECSVIAEKTLGKTITIHTGGVDHIPVHHTNEIAQSEAANGQQFAKLWAHNEHMLVEGEKMSKSLENDYKLEDLNEMGSTPLEFRLLMLSSKYRSQQNFTQDSLADARMMLNALMALGDRIYQPQQTESNEATKLINQAEHEVLVAFQNDLNTPEAISVISRLKDKLDTLPISNEGASQLLSFLQKVDDLTGLKITLEHDIPETHKQAIAKRVQLREQGDYQGADKVRDELLASNIDLNDTPFGTLWSKKR